MPRRHVNLFFFVLFVVIMMLRYWMTSLKSLDHQGLWLEVQSRILSNFTYIKFVDFCHLSIFFFRENTAYNDEEYYYDYYNYDDYQDNYYNYEEKEEDTKKAESKGF